MFLITLSFLSGILSLNLCQQVPGTVLYLLLGITALAWYPARNRRYGAVTTVVLLYLAGMSWAQMHASRYLQHRLPDSLAGSDIVITGYIGDIPVTDETVQRFILEVEDFRVAGLSLIHI